MVKLLNLTIKINGRNKYQNATGSDDSANPKMRVIELAAGGLEIKDQAGQSISELKISSNSSYDNRTKLLVNNIRKIKITFSLDIPISWAWENKKTDPEIQFTFKNLKYDEGKGLGSGPLGTGLDTLFLEIDDFEVAVWERAGKKFFRFWQMIELSPRNNAVIFQNFSDLYWKSSSASGEEQITLAPQIRNWQNSDPNFSEEGQFYELKNINDGQEEVKAICQNFSEIIQYSENWREIGVKTVAEALIAKENGFDIAANPVLDNLVSEEGKYKGFSIVNGEKYQTLATLTSYLSHLPISASFKLAARNRYTKENIDTFRELFSNNLDQSDPRYFHGFRPGDLEKVGEVFYSAFHQQDIKDSEARLYKISEREDFTRTYYELKSCSESKNLGEKKEHKQQINQIIFRPQAFNEWSNKTKKEHWDLYWKWLDKFWRAELILRDLRSKLNDLLPLLDKTSYAGENKDNLSAAWKTLQNYENPVVPGSDEQAIEKRFSAEIKAKKSQIGQLIKGLIGKDIAAAAQENYGSEELSSERKKIFVDYRDQIETEAILVQIKALIRLLVKGEKVISEANNQLERMIFANQLKAEYQNGGGDQKTAYNIVNQVDNQWVDRVITDLEKLVQKDRPTLLAEYQTKLSVKYNHSAAAQAVFANQVLDSVTACQEAEKLFLKVQEAEEKNDTDTSLLTFLESYQKARGGTIKNKAWQAVNSYNQQAEAAIKHLQATDQSREEVIKLLQKAKNETELQAAYHQVQRSQLYKLGYKSRKFIDCLRQRKRVLFQVEKAGYIGAENKALLTTALVNWIPDTIKNDNDEQRLTELEKQLKIFQTAPKSAEKGKVYQEFKNSIDQVINEISQEKQRYQQVKSDLGTAENDDINPTQGGLPSWAWGIIIVGSIMAVGIIILVVIQNFWTSSELDEK